uniref:Pre-mRNA-splicing factor SLU7 n=1 Tax=Schistosoma curassoni TaxID=6186 RepID=A0A183JUG0_9TREM
LIFQLSVVSLSKAPIRYFISYQEEPAASAAKPSLDDDGDFDAEDGDKYGDELDMPGQKFDSKQRQSIRNLRIREDTAKYLFNLDPNSAYYDSKTRAMRGNPFENSGKPESEVPFAGDNFVRYDGDVQDMIDRQVFAWEMHDKLGLDVHLQVSVFPKLISIYAFHDPPITSLIRIPRLVRNVVLICCSNLGYFSYN